MKDEFPFFLRYTKEKTKGDVMKKKLLPILVFIGSSTHAQEINKYLLETPTKDSVYYPKEVLNLPTAPPAIKSIFQLRGFTSYQVNVDINGNDIRGDAANEPSIAVNPLNPNQIAIGWRQFNSIGSDFRQAGRSYSDDGGITWNYQEVFEPGVFRSDPVLESDADGTFYYQSLKVVNNIFNVDQWMSVNGGRTWTNKLNAYGGDKSWFAIDKTNGPGRGNIYAAWNVAGNSYAPSTYNNLIYGSNTFTYPVTIPRNPIFGTVDFGNDQNFYVIGIEGYGQSYRTLYLAKSANPENPAPTFHQTTKVDMGGPVRIGGIVNEVGLDGQLNVNLDKSNRASENNVYVLGSINSADPDDPLDIMFVRSTDGGLTFSEPRRINTDESGNWQWLGTMSVAPNGRIDVIWNDTRNRDGSVGNIATSSLYYTYSYDAGMTFAQEQGISPYFNHLLGYPVQRKMGDYIDMESDNLGAHIAYTATFNGGQDVYYLNAKPSAVEENPDFPTIFSRNVWASSEIPRQGILSTTLINNANQNNPLLAFDAIFTTKPDGKPFWLIATGQVPLEGDSYSIPVYIPTGDLSENGKPTQAIGKLTKYRVRDLNGELVDNRLRFDFDFSDNIKSWLVENAGNQYDENYFDTNPYREIIKSVTLNSLIPRQQSREDTCNINGQILETAGEKSEGRVQYTYRRDDKLNLFAADFTYKKNINENNELVYELDENGLAIPTWEVMSSIGNGVDFNNSVTNQIYKITHGPGFMEIGDDPGLVDLGTEQVTENGEILIITKPDSIVEEMSIQAFSAYCGDIIY